MAAKSSPRPATPAAERAGPLLTIHPTDVFTLAGARAALHLTKTTIRREVREGRLRISCRAGRRWLLGRWLIEWLEGGELPREHANGRPHATGTPADRPAGHGQHPVKRHKKTPRSTQRRVSAGRAGTS
jgi:hypothetical protein